MNKPTARKSHRNTTRKTNKERAIECARAVIDAIYAVDDRGCGTPNEFRNMYREEARKVIEHAIQAAVRQAAARRARRGGAK